MMKLLVLLTLLGAKGPCEFYVQQHRAAEEAYADRRLDLNVAVVDCLRAAKTDSARVACQKSKPDLYNKMIEAKNRAEASRRALNDCLAKESK